ncbi:MAG: glycosyltransferase family 2 protein, partial [Candidatus Omnitrophota bacterium]
LLLFLASSFVQLKRSCDFLFKKKDWRVTDPAQFLPSVSIIVPVYNEELAIGKKVENFIGLDYPKEKIELIFSSDGSNDRTVEIAGALNLDNVKVLDLPRKGKANALNNAIRSASGEVVVFSDACALLDAGALKKLTRHFSDPRMGCAIGEIYMETEGGKAIEDIYGRYEIILKYMENKIGAAFNASGAIYAIRKEAFKELPLWIINDDFIIPLLIKGRGYKVVYDSEAVAFEKPPKTEESEFKRRIRIGIGGFQGLKVTGHLLNPAKGPVALAYWSHKVLRWLSPMFLILSFLLNIYLLPYLFYRLIFLAQIGFYELAFMGFAAQPVIRGRMIYRVPYYFVYMNTALFFGFLKFVSGAKMSTWEKTSR